MCNSQGTTYLHVSCVSIVVNAHIAAKQCTQTSGSSEGAAPHAGVPYDLTPEFLQELFTKHNIDYVVHGDDPCLLPDGTDAYAHAKRQGRFRMVHLPFISALG